MCYTNKKRWLRTMTHLEERLDSQIDIFIQLHHAIEQKWLGMILNEGTPLINFNRKKIKEIESDIDILEYIYRYRNFLSKMAPYMNIVSFEQYSYRTRVKEILSISDKIDRMRRSENVNHGSVVINKVLNDLYGARVTIDENFDYETLKESIAIKFPNEKVINSCKSTGYKGVHFYVKEKIGHFRWELQIWRKSDEKRNTELHEIYKRGYIEKLEDLRNRG
jgi:hypothetical protein